MVERARALELAGKCRQLHLLVRVLGLVLPASSALIAPSPPRAEFLVALRAAACFPSTKETNRTASARLTAKKAPRMIMDVKYTHDHGLTASFA